MNSKAGKLIGDFVVYGIFISSLFLYGCRTAQKHIELASKHQEKAISKGAVIENKTDTVTVVNTVTNSIKGDTIFVKETVTITKEGEVRYVTKRDKKHERKEKSLLLKRLHKQQMKSIGQKGKTDRVESRQENKTERRINGKRNWWWIWLIAGIAIGFFLRLLIKQIGL